MAITAERMKLVNDFCALVSDNTNVLAREDIEDFLNEIQMDELVDTVVETLKKRGVRIISRANGEHLDSGRAESEAGTDRAKSEAGTDRASEWVENNSYDEYLIENILKKMKTNHLSANEEYELANQIAEGRSADTILEDKEKSELLSEQERSTLQNTSELGKIARDRMIESNLYLVVMIAKRYIQPNRYDLLDLIQEGNLGLIKAVDQFDCSKGYAFKDYATWWIRQAITRATMNHVKIDPTFVMSGIRKRFEELFRKAEDSVSSETSVGEEKDHDHEDFVSEIHPANLEKEQNGLFIPEIEEEEKSFLMHEVCAEVWTKLSEREKRIMLHRYRVGDPGAQPFEKDVQEASVTRERVRQVEAKIIEIMRRSLKRRKQS